MDQVAYFFRGGWEDYKFRVFTPVHFFLIGLALVGVILILKYRKELKFDSGSRLKKLFLAGLLLEQILQYGWYALAKTFTLGDGLPLYICRTAIIALILALSTGAPLMRSLAVYWGTLGGVPALLVPVLYPMYFPHITNFTYFFGHTIMVWSVVYILAVEEFRLTREGLVFALTFTNLFNLGVFWLNPKINGNYSYFEVAPVWQATFASWPRPIYITFVFVTYNLLILSIHWIFTRLGNTHKAIAVKGPAKGNRPENKF